MVRLLIVLFWLSLIVGTCVATSAVTNWAIVVANWAVCLLAFRLLRPLAPSPTIT